MGGVHSVVMYGDGTSWSVDSPNQAYVLNGIYAPTGTVPGLGTGGVIAVGDDETPGHTQINPSSVVSDTHTTWQSVPPVPQGTGTNLFFGVGSAPGGAVGAPEANEEAAWAVGYLFNLVNEDDATLIEGLASCLGPQQGFLSDTYAHSYGNPCPRPLVLEPQPRPRPCTPGTPGTATPTPTWSPQFQVCALQVNTFSTYINHLANKGVVGGYPCGGTNPQTGQPQPCVPPANLPYFAPGNNVTRAQLSKMVMLDGIAPPHLSVPFDSQRFQDVAPGSTFYDYIQALAGMGAIGGYPCGGPGEPCVPPDNLPYFRPNAQVTRGQTAKIVASVKGLPAPAPGQQTFQDVPPSGSGSTFWRWVEALASTGAISGYRWEGGRAMRAA